MIIQIVDEKYLDEMISLFISSFNSSPWHDKWTREIVQKRLLQLIHTDGFFGLLLFSEDNTLIGLIMGVEDYSYDDKEFVIKEFCIDNNKKGKGLGSLLIKEMEDKLKEKGYSKITLMTLKNKNTIGFYEKQGYEQIKTLSYMKKSI